MKSTLRHIDVKFEKKNKSYFSASTHEDQDFFLILSLSAPISGSTSLHSQADVQKLDCDDLMN
jgi:hypothetical protein